MAIFLVKGSLSGSPSIKGANKVLQATDDLSKGDSKPQCGAYVRIETVISWTESLPSLKPVMLGADRCLSLLCHL